VSSSMSCVFPDECKTLETQNNPLLRSRRRRQSQKGPNRLGELQAAFRAVAASAFGVWASWAGRWVV